MSIPSNSNTDISLQKPSAQPSTDGYGNPLPQLLSKPRSCEAAAGINWLVKAFALFKSQPLLWFGISATLFVIIGIASALPLINILITPMMFIFIGGIIKGAATQAQGDELRFDHLFSGFKSHWQPLAIVGLLYLVGVIICMIPLFIALGSMMFSMFTGDMGGAYGSVNDISMGGLLLGYLLSMLLLIPLLMAIWFAPALVVMHDVDAITAMKKSFQGSMANLLPMLVYGLICILLLPVVIIFTLGLGVFVVFPIILLTYYSSYRDVWTDQPLLAA